MSSFLILRLSALGDVIHTLPAVEAIRTAHPHAPIGWVVEKPFAELVRLAAPVDEVFVVATRRWRKSLHRKRTWMEVRGALRQIREFGAGSVVLDFQGLTKSALIGRIARPQRQVTFEGGAVREVLAGWLATDRVSVDITRHVIEQNLQLAAAFAPNAGEIATPGLARFAADPSGVVSRMRTMERVVINPGAGRPDKLWGAERFAAVGRALTEEGYGTPLILWGPGEEELAIQITRRGGGEAMPPTDLREMSEVLRRARLVLSGDTGPLHIAAAFGTPVVALFGPTDPRRNGPWGQADHVVSTWVDSRRMADIHPEAVIRKILEVDRQWREAQRSE